MRMDASYRHRHASTNTEANRIAESPVDFAPVSDFHGQDRSSLIINCVGEPLFALPYPILLFCGQFFASMRTGITHERLNPSGDALTAAPEGIFKFFDGRRLDEDPIAVHAASDP